MSEKTKPMTQLEIEHWFIRCKDKVVLDIENRLIEFSSAADQERYEAAARILTKSETLKG